jgi:hypothetical protein
MSGSVKGFRGNVVICRIITCYFIIFHSYIKCILLYSTSFYRYNDSKNRGVAQFGSAQRSGRWGRGFESHRPDTSQSLNSDYFIISASQSNAFSMFKLYRPINPILSFENILFILIIHHINTSLIQSNRIV